MPRWLRWIGYTLLGLMAIVSLALVVVYVTTTSHLNRTYQFPDSDVRATRDSAALTRGRHLVEVMGKCAGCHGADYGGHVISDNIPFGRLAAANLTPGRGGISDYSDADLERAIRHGVGRTGRPLIFMPAEAYAVLSDGDLAALIGYLRTLPPVDRTVPPPRIGPLPRVLYLVGNFPLLAVEKVDHNARQTDPDPADTLEYGRYLATIGGCRACHGMALKGDANPDAPPIDRERLHVWTEADLFRALREGRRPDGTVLDPEKMPWVQSGRMTDDEIRAVWRYLRS
ncbi:MAG TPA: c-type cytochrome [Gemmatimonadales bacterium]|nr:c-type cytochrome [Gemmatimonadales bacterium]